MKEGIVTPARVVNLTGIPALRRAASSDTDGLRLGALVTLSADRERSGDSPTLPRARRCRGACGDAAGPQRRDDRRQSLQTAALLVFPQPCTFAPRANCRPPRDPGENQYHAIFDNAHTAMVHASTPATALVAYDASVHLTGPRGRSRERAACRTFLLPPRCSRDRDADIARGEVLTHITRPAACRQARDAAYHKQTERDSYDWPICDVAVVLRMDGEQWSRRRRSCSAGSRRRRGVRPRAKHCCIGREIDERRSRRSGRARRSAARRR